MYQLVAVFVVICGLLSDSVISLAILKWFLHYHLRDRWSHLERKILLVALWECYAAHCPDNFLYFIWARHNVGSKYRESVHRYLLVWPVGTLVKWLSLLYIFVQQSWTQVLGMFRAYSRLVVELRSWKSLTMNLAGNKAKRFSSVNYSAVAIHHHIPKPSTHLTHTG